jgi:hypothetical protein
MTSEISTERPTQVRFLCCLRNMPFKRTLDNEGFLVCPEHKQRRYGWRSANLKRYNAYPFDHADPQYVWRPDYSQSALEQDQLISADIFRK